MEEIISVPRHRIDELISKQDTLLLRENKFITVHYDSRTWLSLGTKDGEYYMLQRVMRGNDYSGFLLFNEENHQYHRINEFVHMCWDKVGFNQLKLF